MCTENELLGYYIGISESVTLERIFESDELTVYTCLEGQSGEKHVVYFGSDPIKANKIFLEELNRINNEMNSEGT